MGKDYAEKQWMALFIHSSNVVWDARFKDAVFLNNK